MARCWRMQVRERGMGMGRLRQIRDRAAPILVVVSSGTQELEEASAVCFSPVLASAVGPGLALLSASIPLKITSHTSAGISAIPPACHWSYGHIRNSTSRNGRPKQDSLGPEPETRRMGGRLRNRSMWGSSSSRSRRSVATLQKSLRAASSHG